MLTHAWGTQLLAPLDLCAFMACVELPTGLQDATEEAPRQLQVRKSVRHPAAEHPCQRWRMQIRRRDGPAVQPAHALAGVLHWRQSEF